MSPTIALLTILGALLVGAISPGPSFVFIMRTSVAQSRGDGLAGALGMGVGAAFYGALALLGLKTLMTEASWLYFVLKIAGGLYLIYLGYRIWMGANEPVTASTDTGDVSRRNLAKSFVLGLATQLSNPKIVAVFGAVFAALMPENAPLWLSLTLPPLIFVQETAWYALVAIVFSSVRPRAIYLGAKLWIDRVAAAVIGVLGIRLLIEAR